MAHYVGTVTVERPPAEVFELLADMTNAPSWDPGVASATAVGPGPVGEGSEFDLTVSVLGRKLPLRYRVVAHEPPRRVVLRAENGMVRSVDEILVSGRPGGGCAVTYDARLEARVLGAVVDPVLSVLFRRIGDRAMAGLRARLAP